MQSTIRKMSSNLIILGAPGGGKGTICSMLIADFGYHHLSSGNLLREHATSQSSFGKEIKLYLDKGELVPDDLIVDTILSQLKPEESYIFDGFPRTVNQAEILNKKVNIDAVIALKIPHETIIQRLSNRWVHLPSGRTYAYDMNPPKVHGKDDVTGELLERREDDQPETIQKRLITYETLTLPVIDFFSNCTGVKVESFHGTKSKVIYEEIKKFLKINNITMK
jgi:nucleoside-triphosphate--adenylate kinase